MKNLLLLIFLFTGIYACSSSSEIVENTETEILQSEMVNEKREMKKVENMIDKDKEQLDSMKKELEKMGLPSD